MIQEVTEEKGVYVSLDLVWQDSYRKYDSRLSELSITGGHVDCLAQGSVGELINFKMRLPTGHWIALQGKVTYSDYPTGFGFVFTQLSRSDKQLIAQVIVDHGGKYAEKYLSGETPDFQQKTANVNKILVADDDALTLRMLAAIIESQNYQVVAVEDGREAFKVLQKDSNFIAAIFDMMMPHLDGLDLIQYMKTDNRLNNIPIGMITAEQDPKIWNDSVAAGASVFLPKPFNPQQVKMMIGMLTTKNQV